jgi:hypothetical protein
MQLFHQLRHGCDQGRDRELALALLPIAAFTGVATVVVVVLGRPRATADAISVSP